jgi:hypothetical protein
MNNSVKPFLWNKISKVELTKEMSDASEQLTGSTNEESNSKVVDIILDKN